MAISAAELNIILSAKDKEFKKAMAANERRVQRFSKNSQKNLSKTSKAFGDLGSAAKRLGPLLAGALGAQAMRSMLQSTVQIGRLSNVAGVSVERFQELTFAGEAFGVSQEKMADILKDVNDKFGDFVTTGAGPLADFFEKIAPKVGLTVDSFKGLSSEQVLGKYVKGLQDANVSQAQMVFFMEAIASDASALTGLFKDNGKELEKFIFTLRENGGVMSKELIDKAAEATEKFNLLSNVISTNLKVAFSNLLPVAQAVADVLTDIFSAGTVTGEQKRDRDALLNWMQKLKKLNTDLIEAREDRPGLVPDFVKQIKQAIDQIQRLKGFPEQTVFDGESFSALPARPKRNGGGGGNGGLSAAAEAALKREAALRAGNIAILENYTQAVIDGETAAVEMAAETADRLVAVQEAYDGVRSSLDPLRDATLAYAESIQAVNAALAQGLISEEQAAIDREKLTENFQAIKDEASGLTESLDVIGDSFATAFGDMISGTMSVEDAFKRMAGTIISELIKIQFQQMQTGGSSGSMIGGLLQAGGDLVGGLLGNAQGGTVQAGRPTTVGEHGRELFVPSVAGRILSVPQSKSALGGGGGVTVQQTINVSTGVQQTVRAEIQSMMPQIASASTKAVLNARRRGGSFAGAFA